MKKSLLTFFIFLSTLISGQILADFSPKDWNKFQTYGSPGCGVGSLHILVQRSQWSNQLGYYAYEIYFSTNSFLPNCRPSNTYVPDIEISSADMKTKKFVYPIGYYKFWVIVGQTQLVYTLYHQNPFLIIRVKTGPTQASTI